MNSNINNADIISTLLFLLEENISRIDYNLKIIY